MQLDQEDIKSYKQRTFFDPTPKNELNPTSIFFAVLAAILVSWFIRAVYLEYQARQELALFNQYISVINEEIQQQLKNTQLQTEAMRARIEENARLKTEVLRRQKQLAQQIDLAKREEISHQINARVRKDEAWAAAYKPIRGCEKDNPDRDAIKCGNDYAKAHRQFEASWTNSR